MTLSKTEVQYKKCLNDCRSVVLKKNEDYGSAWRILRLPSFTDQMYIKAMRIRSLEEKGQSLVGDDIEGEYKALVNYGIMVLIQIRLGGAMEEQLTTDRLAELYDIESRNVMDLMMKKNHDYGEAWRDMRIESITDLILVKLLRIKQIEDNDGQTIISEGVEGNYSDIINYALFALIRLNELKEVRNDN